MAGHGRLMKMPVAVIIGMLVVMGIMAGIMFGPALFMSRMGMPATAMRAVMYLPLAGMVLMAGTMFFFYRRMTGRRSRRIGGGAGQSAESGTLSVTYSVPDVNCSHCKKTIENALGQTRGIAGVDVDVDSKRATVRYAEGIAPAEIAVKLAEIGYPPAKG